MLTLRTLGTADLRDAKNREVRAVLQQPKRLALLVYLATAKPGRLHRRDSLLGLFWPHLDQEHARAALRRALYFLRQACGADAFQSRGDEEVGITAGLLWCDALAFDEAVAGNDPAKAMELYRGDFLDGFYVQGGPEAEAWIDRERARRREEAAAASWALAERSIGDDPSQAPRWARQALELAPFGDDALIRFAERADQAGERSVGLRVVESYLQRLATELDVEAGSALQALADRLRGDGRSEPVSRDTGSIVAVCPFVIRGDKSVAYLREGMVDLLSTKLDGTGNLRTVDPPTVIRLAAAKAPHGVDVSTGREFAQELGAGSYVVGTIIESGGRLEAGVGLYDGAGKLRARAEARTDVEADLFELVDELVRRLVVELSRTPPDRLVRLAALTTTSLPALKAHLAGEHEFRLGRHLQALDAFRRATDLDPSFALAYYRLASSLAASALAGPAREASGAAYQHRDRLSDHDRLLLEAQHAWLIGQTADAVRRYAALTVSF
ncbi:MAG: BTAD domain-containing putative transcriptional regulator, partial [Gemmatimonadales bacterium]